LGFLEQVAEDEERCEEDQRADDDLRREGQGDRDPEQADRADATWGKYTKVELSPKVKYWQEAFRNKRAAEIAAYKERAAAK